MAALDLVVEALVCSVIGTWCLAGDQFDVAAQLVGDNNHWLAELSNQLDQKALGGLRVAACLNQNVERVTIGVDRASQPVLHSIDPDHNLIHVPLVVRSRWIAADTGGKMRTKPVDPQADCFAADDHAALRL